MIYTPLYDGKSPDLVPSLRNTTLAYPYYHIVINYYYYTPRYVTCLPKNLIVIKLWIYDHTLLFISWLQRNRLLIFSLGNFLGLDFTDDECRLAGKYGEIIFKHYGVIHSDFDVPECHGGERLCRVADTWIRFWVFKQP